MSDIREVTVRYGRTANLGNFESERVDVELRAMVAEGENWSVVLKNVGLLAQDEVDALLVELARKRREAIDDAPLHLTDEQVRRLGGKP